MSKANEDRSAEQQGCEARRNAESSRTLRSLMFSDEIEREWCVSKVEQKVAEYRKSDQLERAKRGNIPTISAVDAMQLLEETGGICSCCGCEMKLSGWPRKPDGIPAVLAEGYNRQFSFDRINNNDTHNRDNLRIVCLKCNILSADMVFMPNYQIRSGNSCYAAWQEYEYIKIAFNKLEYVCIRGKNRDLVDADIWKYHRALKSYMAYLHDLIYGDFDSDGNLIGSRKQNNWKKFGIEADGSQPHIGVLKQSFARYNMEYYLRESNDSLRTSASLRGLWPPTPVGWRSGFQPSSLDASVCIPNEG